MISTSEKVSPIDIVRKARELIASDSCKAPCGEECKYNYESESGRGWKCMIFDAAKLLCNENGIEKIEGRQIFIARDMIWGLMRRNTGRPDGPYSREDIFLAIDQNLENPNYGNLLIGDKE